MILGRNDQLMRVINFSSSLNSCGFCDGSDAQQQHGLLSSIEIGPISLTTMDDQSRSVFFVVLLLTEKGWKLDDAWEGCGSGLYSFRRADDRQLARTTTLAPVRPGSVV